MYVLCAPLLCFLLPLVSPAWARSEARERASGPESCMRATNGGSAPRGSGSEGCLRATNGGSAPRGSDSEGCACIWHGSMRGKNSMHGNSCVHGDSCSRGTPAQLSPLIGCAR
eukprot:275085-Chlamydomonas_euryale.AAC.4